MKKIGLKDEKKTSKEEEKTLKNKEKTLKDDGPRTF